jgi:hypothetical protein
MIPVLSRGLLAFGIAMFAWMVTGCAADRPKSHPPKQQIQEDSDRFFEKLRQEEHEHRAGPG